MKRVRFVAALVTVALILTVAGCSEWQAATDSNFDGEESTDAVSTEDLPVETYYASYITLVKDYTLAACMEEAEAIVDVTFIENLGTGDTDGEVTFFRAKVNRTVKGDVSDEITILQMGSIEFPITDYPIFKSGDRLLLFLFGEDCNREKFLGKYWITGEYSTLLDLCEYEGVSYLLSRPTTIALTQDLVENEEIERISDELRSAIVEKAKENNPNVSRQAKVFSYDDFTDVIRAWEYGEDVG